MKLHHLSIVLLACGLLPAAARGSVIATIEAKFVHLNGGAGTQVNLYNASSGGSVITPANTTQAGMFEWEADPDSYDATELFLLGGPEEFISFCIELTQSISKGQTYTLDLIELADAPNPANNPNTPMGDNAAGLIKMLWAQYFEDYILDEGTVYVDGTGYIPGYSEQERRGAFQLAIWELVYDKGDVIDLENGYFQAVKAMSGTKKREYELAEYLLANLASGDMATLYAISNNGKQDQLVWLELPQEGDDEVIPEPSSMVTLGLLLGTMGVLFCRKGRRTAAK